MVHIIIIHHQYFINIILLTVYDLVTCKMNTCMIISKAYNSLLPNRTYTKILLKLTQMCLLPPEVLALIIFIRKCANNTKIIFCILQRSKTVKKVIFKNSTGKICLHFQKDIKCIIYFTVQRFVLIYKASSACC